jgi:hypothetical protein
MTILEAASALRRKDFSSLELTVESLDRTAESEIECLPYGAG